MQKNPWKIYGDILLTSLRSALRSHPFGFAYLTSLTSILVFTSLFQEGAPLFLYSDLAEDFALEHRLFVLFVGIAIIIAYTISKSALIYSLDEKKRRISKDVRAAFRRFVTFEITFFLSLFAVAGVLLLPSILTSSNPSLSNNLLILGAFAFVPIFLIGLLLETFGSFYLLFSKTGLRASCELAYTLLAKHIATILVFGALFSILLITLSILAGSLFELIRRGIPDNTPILLMVFYGFQAFLKAFSKASWYGLFRFIAGTKVEEEASQESENVLQQEVPQGNV